MVRHGQPAVIMLWCSRAVRIAAILSCGTAPNSEIETRRMNIVPRVVALWSIHCARLDASDEICGLRHIFEKRDPFPDDLFGRGRHSAGLRQAGARS